MEVRIIGNMDNTIDHTFESANRVYDKNGLCPTIPTCAGGNIQPKVIEETKCVGGSYKYCVAMRGRNPEHPTDRTPGLPTEQRLEPRNDGVCNTLTSVQKDNLVLEKKPDLQYRIRKLTPRECYRLMDFPDSDFDKAESVISNTRLYKTAGNAIVRAVLMALFLQMNIQGIKNWNNRTDGEKRALLEEAR